MWTMVGFKSPCQLQGSPWITRIFLICSPHQSDKPGHTIRKSHAAERWVVLLPFPIPFASDFPPSLVLLSTYSATAEPWRYNHTPWHFSWLSYLFVLDQLYGLGVKDTISLCLQTPSFPRCIARSWLYCSSHHSRTDWKAAGELTDKLWKSEKCFELSETLAGQDCELAV